MSTIVRISRVKGDVFKAIVRIKGIKPYSRTFQTRRAAKHWLKAEKETVDLVTASSHRCRYARRCQGLLNSNGREK